MPIIFPDIDLKRFQKIAEAAKQKAADAGNAIVHGTEVVGERALHSVPEAVGFVGDIGADLAIMNPANLLRDKANQLMGWKPEHPDMHLQTPGSGPASKAVIPAFEKQEQSYTHGQTPRARNKAEQVLGDAADYATQGLLSGGGEGALSRVIGGAGAGVGQDAVGAVTKNPYAQFAGAIVGGLLAHHISENVIPTLEGGGTLAEPKVNGKSGAMGVMQVTPETARDPGYNIPAWDGKSQADLARVGRQKYMVLDQMFQGDSDKALAAYNWGEGHVMRAVKKYGDNWLDHAPEETQNYVSKGRKLIGNAQGPENLGPVEDLTESEQPLPSEQEAANNALAPGDENPFHDTSDTPDTPDNVHSLDDARSAKQDGMNEDSIDENLGIAYKIDRGIDSGHITEQHLPYIEASRDKLQGVLEDFQDELSDTQRAKIQANVDSLSASIEKLKPSTGDVVDISHLTDPGEGMSGENRYAASQQYSNPTDPKVTSLAEINPDYIKEKFGRTDRDTATAQQTNDASVENPPSINDATDRLENHSTNEKPGAPANDSNFEPRHPDKTLHDYTDAEFKSLSPKDQRDLAVEQNARQFPDDYPRDHNPPASSSISGTQGPIQKRYINQPMKAEEGHDLPKVEVTRKKVVDKLGQVLEQTKPLQREAADALSRERARKLAAVYKVRGEKGGEAGFYSELKALKGSMGRPKIESIRGHFSQAEIDMMYDGINKSPHLQGWETIQAKDALRKLLGKDYGEIPTAREVELLAAAMPEKAKVLRVLLADESGSLNLDALPKIPDGALKKAVVNVAGLPRTLKASFDLSAPFRQGMFLVGRKEFWKAMPDMLKSFISEGHFNKVQDDIFNRPTFHLMNKAGLQTTKLTGNLIDREEAFISQFAEKIPGVRHSERAYMAFLNKVRADVFDDFVRKGELLGIDQVHDPEYLKSAARFINTATGRGSIGALGKDASVLSNVLFSPKLMASRIQLLRPGFYADLHPAVRVEAAKSGLIYAATVGGILGLAAAGGAKVEMDPRSTDFAKIHIGHTRIDVTGGFQPYVRFYAQFLSGQQKSTKDGTVKDVGVSLLPLIRHYFPGEKQGDYKPTTRKDVLYRFLENKEAPNMNEATRLMQESDGVGNPLGTNTNPISDAAHAITGKRSRVGNEIVEQFTPLIASDTYQAYKDLGAKGLLTAIPNTFGVGIQINQKNKVKKSDEF